MLETFSWVLCIITRHHKYYRISGFPPFDGPYLICKRCGDVKNGTDLPSPRPPTRLRPTHKLLSAMRQAVKAYGRGLYEPPKRLGDGDDV